MTFFFSDNTYLAQYEQIRAFIRRIYDTQKYDRAEFLYKISEQIFELREILAKYDLDEVCTLVQVMPVYDFKEELIKLLQRHKTIDIFQSETALQEILENAYAIIFSYIQEYRFKKFHDKNGILESYVNVGLWNFDKFKYARDKINHASNILPFDIIRDQYSKSSLNFLEENKANVANFIQILQNWDHTFKEKHLAVQSLEEKLEEQKRTYDFVLLNKGFKQLYDQKNQELAKAKETYSFVAAVMFVLPLIEFFTFIGLLFYFKSQMPAYIWYLSIPFITMILIIFYLVRVSLQEKRSIQSQMMQLELRMALCQFIHNYADDSETLHKKNKAGFEKFENIIFSPIVASDDKIPSTFDGMEQLAKLFSEFKGKS